MLLYDIIGDLLSGFPTTEKSNQSVKLMKLFRRFKLCKEQAWLLYVPNSEIKGAAQLAWVRRMVYA